MLITLLIHTLFFSVAAILFPASVGISEQEGFRFFVCWLLEASLIVAALMCLHLMTAL